MSAATAAVIVLGADYGLTIGLSAWFADRWLTRNHADAALRPVPAASASVTVPAMTPRPLPPLTAQRQEAYNRAREGHGPAEAAAIAGVTPPRTARDYEDRYRAMLAAQDWAPS